MTLNAVPMRVDINTFMNLRIFITAVISLPTVQLSSSQILCSMNLIPVEAGSNCNFLATEREVVYETPLILGDEEDELGT